MRLHRDFNLFALQSRYIKPQVRYSQSHSRTMPPPTYNVKPGPLALTGLEHFHGASSESRGKLPHLPPLYTWVGPPAIYPQRKSTSSEGRTFFIIIDSSEEGKRQELARTEDIPIPVGRCEHIRDNLGEL